MSTTNPLYAELARTIRRPSTRSARRLSFVIATGLSGVAIVCLYLMDDNPGFELIATLALIGLAPLYIMVATPLALLVTAGFTSRHATTDTLALLRITSVSAERIVDAYERAAPDRLWLIPTLRPGMLLPCAIVLAYWLGESSGANACPPPGGCGPAIVFIYISEGIIPGVIAGVTLFGVAVVWLNLAIKAGVWAALRWRQDALAVAGGLLVVGSAVLMIEGWLTVLVVRSWPLMCFVAPIWLIWALFAQPRSVARLAHERATRALEPA